MAVSTGNTALYSDLKNWYDVFNDLASRFSNGIATLPVPGSGSKISATNINYLNDKINAFRSDYYLGTQASWWPTGTNVTTGTQIKATMTGILGVVTNATRVVCRNISTNASGNHSCGQPTVSCSNVQCQHLDNGYGDCPNGNYYIGCDHVACPNGQNPNGDCPNTSHSYNKKQCGTSSVACNYGSCSRWSGGQYYLYNVNASSVTKSNGWWSNVTRTCGLHTNGTCTSGYHWNTNDAQCTSGSWGNGLKGNGNYNNACTSGWHGNTKKGNTSVVDITCNQNSKTNG